MGVNNQKLDINIDTYPITLNYNSNDLNENKTGFLPVNISVSNPNFVQFYADKYWPNTDPEVPDDQPKNHIFNQPIQFNGKYKFIPFESPPGSFPVSGYIPQYMTDQNATNWDLNINVVNSENKIELKGAKSGSSSSAEIILFSNFDVQNSNTYEYVSVGAYKSLLMIRNLANSYSFRVVYNNSSSANSISVQSGSLYKQSDSQYISLVNNNNENIISPHYQYINQRTLVAAPL